MSTFNILNKVKISNPAANLDVRYGPWRTVAVALTSVPLAVRERGLTVGIAPVAGPALPNFLYSLTGPGNQEDALRQINLTNSVATDKIFYNNYDGATSTFTSMDVYVNNQFRAIVGFTTDRIGSQFGFSTALNATSPQAVGTFTAGAVYLDIQDQTGVEEYWWKNGTQDQDLIYKAPAFSTAGVLQATGPIIIGTDVTPVTGNLLHIKGGNVRIDGTDLSQVPNIIDYDTDGQSLFDLRSANPAANYNLSIASSGVGNFIKFFGGREGDPKPFIVVKTGAPLRVASYTNFYNTLQDFTEHVRVNTDVQTSIPRVTVNGSVSATGSVIAVTPLSSVIAITSRSVTLNQSLQSYTILSGPAVSQTLTFIVPNDSNINFPIGSKIKFLQTSTGVTQISGQTDVTIHSLDNARYIVNQYAHASLLKTAANRWVFYGDISTI